MSCLLKDCSSTGASSSQPKPPDICGTIVSDRLERLDLSLSNHSMAVIVQSYSTEREMAGHSWTSAACSPLISVFHSFTSIIPWLTCENRISNPTATSASHGGARSTPGQAVGDSIPIVVDVSLQMDDRPARTFDKKNTWGTRSTTTAPNSRATFAPCQPGPVHPIAVLFRSQELGKAVMGFAMPMTTGLLFNKHQGLTHLQASAIVLALLVGFAATWNGMLLRGVCPRVASMLEHFGVGSILVAFFGLVSSFLPPSMAWACWLCCGLSCLPFLLCLVPLTAAAGEERSSEWLDQCSVEREHALPDSRVDMDIIESVHTGHCAWRRCARTRPVEPLSPCRRL